MGDHKVAESYPRSLNGAGCLFGRGTRTRVLEYIERQEKEMKEFKDALKAQSRILFGILVALTTASVLMLLNLVAGGA